MSRSPHRIYRRDNGLVLCCLVLFPFLSVNSAQAAPFADLDAVALTYQCLQTDSGCDVAQRAMNGHPFGLGVLGTSITNAQTYPADERARIHALNCAFGRSDHCAALADAVRTANHAGAHYFGALLDVNACALGIEDRCPDNTYIEPNPMRLNFTQDDAKKRGLDPQRDTIEDEKIESVVSACDQGDDASCRALARIANRWTDAVLDWSQGYCKRNKSSVACVLPQSLNEWGQFTIADLDGDAYLLERACYEFEIPSACTGFASLRSLDATRPWGGAKGRQAITYACIVDAQSLACVNASWPIMLSGMLQDVVLACHPQQPKEQWRDSACAVPASLWLDQLGDQEAKNVQAERTLTFSCARGDARSCWMAAKIATRLEQPERHRQHLQAGCALQDALACTHVLAQQRSQAGPAESGSWYQRFHALCEGGATLACGIAVADVERAVSFPGTDIERTATIQELRLLGCAQGSVNACVAVGDFSSGREQQWQLPEGFGTSLLGFACAAKVRAACSTLIRPFQLENGESQQLPPEQMASVRWAAKILCDEVQDDGCQVLAAAGDGSAVPPDRKRVGIIEQRFMARPDPVEHPLGTQQQDPSDRPPSKPKPPIEHELPRPVGRATIADGVIGVGVGGARMWWRERQSSVIKATLHAQGNIIGFGIDVEWASDNRWRPKQGRSYWRIDANAHVLFSAFLAEHVTLNLGFGGGGGVFRRGPGTNYPLAPVFHLAEFFEFGVPMSTLYLGIRVEQRQLFHPGAIIEFDHATSFSMVIGIFVDDF